jgi:multicopper oxidase
MKRRDFFLTGAGAMALAALPPLSRRALASDVVEYRLTSAPLSYAPAPGVRFSGLAYNGTIPGPLLRVTYGQRVRVRYTSRVDIPTSVHWHGMILPNAMDGVAYVTQPPVLEGGEFVYEFKPDPPGTRWYHDHAFHMGIMRGLFGMFAVEDPSDEPADREFALVFHDVPQWSTVEAAIRGVSAAPMSTLPGSPERMEMMRSMKPMSMGSMGGSRMNENRKMGDEVAFIAHCIDGATYPRTRKLPVRVGDRVRLRILNASPTQTRYVRLAQHRLLVTHSDGNRLAKPIEVDALRIGVAERYDAYFEVKRPGAFLLQGLTGDALGPEQSALLYTEGMEHVPPASSPRTLVGVDYYTYQKAGGLGRQSAAPPGSLLYDFTLGGGAWGSNRWTIDDRVWPHTPKIVVHRGDHVTVRFTNKTDMEHPMHLHGHVFEVVEVGGSWLARPLRKDVSLVPANGGTLSWRFHAEAPPGRWLLHCHNDIHMMDGMMTEVRYR